MSNFPYGMVSVVISLLNHGVDTVDAREYIEVWVEKGNQVAKRSWLGNFSSSCLPIYLFINLFIHQVFLDI